MGLLNQTLALCLAGAGVVSAVLAAPVADPLARPATINSRARDALLTAVARAGGRLVAVGERGLVLLSDDHGRTWRQARAVPVAVLLTAVRFSSAQSGWAVGHSGVVLHTGDGGETWRKQLDGNELGKLAVRHAEAQPDAGATGSAAARRLAEAQRLASDGADKPLLAVLAQNDASAIVVGAFGLAFRTGDGGKSWQPWHFDQLSEKGSHLYAIEQVGASVYVAGEQGSLFGSSDGGATLRLLATPYKGSYFGLTVLSERALVAYGLRGSAYVSHDGGASWAAAAVGTPASLTAGLALPDGRLLLASQAGTAFASKDQGRHFATVQRSAPAPVVGMALAADGGVVLVGIRGASRMPSPIHPTKGSTP